MSYAILDLSSITTEGWVHSLRNLVNDCMTCPQVAGESQYSTNFLSSEGNKMKMLKCFFNQCGPIS